MTHIRRLSVATALGGLAGALIVGVPGAAAGPSAAGTDTSTSAASAATTAKAGALPAGGRGTAVPRLIDQRTNPAAPDVASTSTPAVRGLDGRPTGSSLPSRASQGRKPAPASARRTADGPNTAGSAPTGPLLPSPTRVRSNFNGINQAAGGGAQPSDVNASIGATQILETVNRRVTVYSKRGAQQCSNTLAGWLGLGTTNVFDPRTLYDNVNRRFIIIATTTGTAGQAPRLFLAASRTANACGAYFVYTLSFSGGLFPAGALLDYPYLGQDRTAILSSSNNFNPGYINSTAWSVSKAQVYAGAGVSFPAFAVAFSTAPVTVTGVPIGATANAYYVAGRPGFGYNLYRMSNTAGPGTTLTLQAEIANSYTAPTRRVNQCDTAVTLDPLDGRIAWSPVQAVNSPFIWFTHGIDIGGFPGIRYGAISTTGNTATVATAFHNGSSDDFNPSLGAFESAPNAFYIWLNWAYTDNPPGSCRFTSTTVNGVAPGGGVPSLTGSDRTLVIGSQTTTNTRFGDYSSVHLDPSAVSSTCPRGRTALLAQQYFVGGQWATRLSRVSFGSGC